MQNGKQLPSRKCRALLFLVFYVGLFYSIRIYMSLVMTIYFLCKTQYLKQHSIPVHYQTVVPLNKIEKENDEGNRDNIEGLVACNPALKANLTRELCTLRRCYKGPGILRRPQEGHRATGNWGGEKASLASVTSPYSSLFGGVYDPWKLRFSWLPKSQPHLLDILNHRRHIFRELNDS